MKVPGSNPWKRLPARELIAPSLLACDFARMGQQIDTVLAAGADVLHVDIMDSRFVPNLSMGPAVVQSLRKYTKAPLDVHIMVADPAFYIERFAEAGADSITFHIEATDRPRELAARLHELGLGAGITLRPGTPAEALAPVIDVVDLVLVMTVEPGWGGQEFIAGMLNKISVVRGMLKDSRPLEVDGGIDLHTAGLCRKQGASVFVAGSYVFRSPDPAKAVRDLRETLR
ncbi:MAG: ribulose-phosphate 3-epimerase [Planctomycetaceae bacterium]|nr:ribulose-phosphate 3-epimerase [Planctomycetaceae bacterium]